MKCLHRSGSTALISGTLTLTYDELFNRIDSYSVLLPERRSSCVAIFSENRPEWIYALYAGWKNGCAVVPIDSAAPHDEIAYIVEDCKPETIFCSRQKLPEVGKALESVSYTPGILVFEECGDFSETDPVPGFDELERSDDETALIIYTSGTTGSPKGAMLSFGNMLANVEAVSREVPIFTSDARALVLLPIHHVLPLGGTIVAPLAVGGTCVFSPSMAPEDILDTLQSHGVTVIVAVPRFFHLIMKGIREKIGGSFFARSLFALAKKLDSPRFSKIVFRKVHRRFGGRIRSLICGGAAIDDDVARDFKALGFDLLTGYGMTETAPLISFTRPGTLRIGASGQISPVNEVKIDEGEIVVRGRNVMKGYFNRPDETAAMIRGGWLYTGDLGYIDPDGFVFVTGRKKDIIVLPNGKNVNPEEIESKVLASFDAVREIGVCLHEGMLHAVMLPDFSRLSELGVHAVEEYFRWEVIGEYNQTAASSKKIMKFTLVKEELPRTRLGKIRRFRLHELIVKPVEPVSAHPEPEDQVYLKIRNFLAAQTEKSVFPGAHLEIDLGMDSLDKVALSSFLYSSFGVKVGDEELLQYATVGEILKYVERTKVKIEEEDADWASILHADVGTGLPRCSGLHVPLGRMIRLLFRLYFRMQVTGWENIPDHPFLLVSNHQSYLDGLVVGTSLDVKVAGRLFFYASEQTFRKAWQRDFITRHNVILVDINRNLKLSLQKMAGVLKKGDSLIIFPEGGVTRDGKMLPFKRTFAILSRELGVPIVPVALSGTFQAMPRGQRFPKFRQAIRVEFLPPVFPEEENYDELVERVRKLIGERVEVPV
jgi:long-chain acyl-CoA synthetase